MNNGNLILHPKIPASVCLVQQRIILTDYSLQVTRKNCAREFNKYDACINMKEHRIKLLMRFSCRTANLLSKPWFRCEHR